MMQLPETLYNHIMCVWKQSVKTRWAERNWWFKGHTFKEGKHKKPTIVCIHVCTGVRAKQLILDTCTEYTTHTRAHPLIEWGLCSALYCSNDISTVYTAHELCPHTLGTSQAPHTRPFHRLLYERKARIPSLYLLCPDLYFKDNDVVDTRGSP